MKREKKEIDYDELTTSINNYLDLWHSSNKSEDKEELYQTTIKCVNALAKIFEECLSYGNFKDNWEYDKFYQHVYGPELIINALKTKCGYSLGLDNKGLYLSTDLRYNENLRYMDDNYWKSLLTLSEFEGFEYFEYELVRSERVKEFPELFNANKSMIYRIIRKYIFDSTETDSRYVSCSVGEFKIVAKFDEDFTQTVKKFCKAFKIMYKLNYELWKVTDGDKKNSR